MRSIGVAILLGTALTAGCGDDTNVIDAGIHDADRDGGDMDAPACIAIAGTRIDFPGAGDDGEFDPSPAHDPASSRVWLSYSGTNRTPTNVVLVSTRLAYSDDAGTTWCDAGLVNPSTPEPAPPAPFSGLLAYWNHEVSDLVFVPGAPASERWQLYWHRYLHVDQATDQRRFEYGWIAARYASTPEGLASATEHKVIAAIGYDATIATTAYNDAHGGAPEHRASSIDPALASCIALSEPGSIATSSGISIAMFCGTGQAATSRIELLERAHAGTWTRRARLLGESEAKAFNAALDGFSAPDIVRSGAVTWLLVTPTTSDIYLGCLGYRIDLGAATVAAVPGVGVEAMTSFGGACSFDETLGARGILYSEAHPGEQPTFWLITTGTIPRPN